MKTLKLQLQIWFSLFNIISSITMEKMINLFNIGNITLIKQVSRTIALEEYLVSREFLEFNHSKIEITNCVSISGRVFGSFELLVPNKIIDIILYGGEFEPLEIHLWSMNDYIDQFFIVESDYDHHGEYKGFVFPKIENISHKLVYIKNKLVKWEPNADMFHYERTIAQTYWNQIVELDKSKWTFYISSHTDEIVSEKTLFGLKNCEILVEPNPHYYSDGIFYYGSANRVLPGTSYTQARKFYKYSFPFPSIWRGNNQYINTFSHKQSFCLKDCIYLYESYHISPYPNLPFEMQKMLSCTECGSQYNLDYLLNKLYEFKDLIKNHKTNSLSYMFLYDAHDISGIDGNIEFPKLMRDNKDIFWSFFCDIDKMINYLKI
jgi:hypothetical protein